MKIISKALSHVKNKSLYWLNFAILYIKNEDCAGQPQHEKSAAVKKMRSDNANSNLNNGYNSVSACFSMPGSEWNPTISNTFRRSHKQLKAFSF